MHYYEIAPTKIIRAATDRLTYASDEELMVGQLVTIPIGKSTISGLVIAPTKKPSFATKPIIDRIESQPLPESLVKLALWLADYYATPLATVLQSLLPRGLTVKRREPQNNSAPPQVKRTHFVLNNDQSAAVTSIQARQPGTTLLHGITGSGKTAVYLELARSAITNNQSAIILVPEIALTSQLVRVFETEFADVTVVHSRLTEANRHTIWRKLLYATTPQVIVGPRSALFMPLQSIGLIVVDEFHEPSFKQEQSPRYSALRAATMLGRWHNARVVLGSATPPVSDYYVATKSHNLPIELPRLARADAVKPTVSLVDMTSRKNFTRHRFLSNTLLDSLDLALANHTQSLIFHNRRGSTTTTLCENCGWIAGCPRCFVPLTLHSDNHELRCHICGYSDRIPTDCPSCHSADIIHKGVGTKLIESELRKLYPDKKIVRFDGDNDKLNSVDARYKELVDGTIDIIIGTQVIAKGLDLPKLRHVGVVQADAGLNLPDYGASERTFQLLAQVIGRVGRASHPTEVTVQSFQPNHPAIRYGLDQDYQAFYTYSLKERERAVFPPFSYLLKLSCSYKTEATAIKNSRQLMNDLKKVAPKNVTLLGPSPAFYERTRDSYRWQIILKSSVRSDLVALLNYLPAKNWQYELDPYSLL